MRADYFLGRLGGDIGSVSPFTGFVYRLFPQEGRF